MSFPQNSVEKFYMLQTKLLSGIFDCDQVVRDERAFQMMIAQFRTGIPNKDKKKPGPEKKALACESISPILLLFWGSQFLSPNVKFPHV